MRGISAHGNGNNEFTAVPLLRTYKDFAIVQLDDALAHGQPDAMTWHGGGGMFPSKKGGKDERLFFDGDARAVVSKAHIDGVFAGSNSNANSSVW